MQPINPPPDPYPLGDARIPLCDLCGANQGTRRARTTGQLLCLECYDEWLMGRFDQDAPEGYHDE